MNGRPDVEPTMLAQRRFVQLPNVANVGPTLGQRRGDVGPTSIDIGPMFMPTFANLLGNFLPNFHKLLVADILI